MALLFSVYELLSFGEKDRGQMKTIAITVFGTRVSSRLDCAESVLLVTVDNNTVKKRERVRPVQFNPLEKINMLIKLGVDAVICGGITEVCSNRFNDYFPVFFNFEKER